MKDPLTYSTEPIKLATRSVRWGGASHEHPCSWDLQPHTLVKGEAASQVFRMLNVTPKPSCRTFPREGTAQLSCLFPQPFESPFP